MQGSELEGPLSYVDYLIEQKKRNKKYFDEYKKYAAIIKKIACEILGQTGSELRVLVFGSVVRGNWVPNRSDIDILIISDIVRNSAHWESQMRFKILEGLNDQLAPFQIHFATSKVYKEWYSRFIKEEYFEVQ